MPESEFALAPPFEKCQAALDRPDVLLLCDRKRGHRGDHAGYNVRAAGQGDAAGAGRRWAWSLVNEPYCMGCGWGDCQCLLKNDDA